MQEIDEVRSTYMREVASLTEACRIEITARREAMGRLEPMKSRADDMTGARRVCSIACRLKLVHLCVVFSSVEDLLFQLLLSIGRFPQIRLPQVIACGRCFKPLLRCSAYMSACRGAGANEGEG